ncbi:helix-turn-helix transcriptional regulator [Actinocorallia sp. A-T 12471]|uniref:helix-turn-helix domain-containing protein n=1 Tax=Actinocorallia sp. A-T 12471 TaxID=3089813 RepID=UPI0029D1FE9C|nr:helix-turn-helix transcriptional regulator [Actinocorallia sp. A-T 12471]MDX6738945.1 helix-turn-helix transcriptional regulator [Actinocorallia sp. A-T 12471]
MSGRAVEARKAFGARLKELRLDAGLTGRALAQASGIHNTTISRIEQGRLSPSEDNIRAWAIACGSARLIPELVAVRREVEQMWVEHRRELKAGLKRVQAEGDLYERTALLRVYESNRVPGILQAPGYVAAAMRAVSAFHGSPGDDDDVAQATSARLARQRLLTEGTGLNRYSFVIEAGALDLTMGVAMDEQFDFLLSVIGLPHVAFGVIPPGRSREIWAGEGFYLFDDTLVRTEMWTGEYRTNRPEEIADYARIFDSLRRSAVYGDAARAQVEIARQRVSTQTL